MDQGSGGGVNLEFSEADHIYTLDGRRVPSVTQVLAMLENWERVPWEQLEAARQFGTNVHKACHLQNRGELDVAALDLALDPYVRAWQRFLVESNATLIASETRVANARLGYAGTLDALVDRRGHTWLVDIKSGDVPDTCGPQTSAYAAALGRPVRRYAVQLKPDGSYKTHAYTSSTDFAIFQSCLNVYKWRERNK
jgi:hypothetical protein